MKKNLKIKYKSKIDKLVTRYLIPLMIVLVFITVFVGLIMIIGYDFGTNLFNIKRLVVAIPVFVILFTTLCSRVGYLWINFIRSIEDTSQIVKHHHGPDIMLDQVKNNNTVEIKVMTLNTVNDNKRIYNEEVIKSGIINTDDEKTEENNVEKLSVNGIPISNDNE